MDRRIIELYDEYTHAPLPRRVFLARLSRLAGGAAAAAALLPLLDNNYALAAMVAEDDGRIITERVTYPGQSGPIKAYLARPRSTSPAPGVLVVHENRGLNPHIEDVARRFAVEGFVALAPDGLSSLGGTPANEDQARDMFAKLDRNGVVPDFAAAVPWLDSHSAVNGKVGAVGFCFGGGIVNQLAVRAPALDAAVVYYGNPVRNEDVPKIQAPLLIHMGSHDTRLMNLLPGFEAALKAANKPHTIHVYEADHAFNNDTGGARYHKAAADLAWGRTLAFLRQHLKG